MPPLPAIKNVFRIRLLGTINNQNWASIQYAQFLGPPPSPSDCATIGTSLSTAWQNALAPLCQVNVHLRTVDVIDLSSDVSSVGSVAVNIAGTRAGNANPNNSAMVASYRINRRYRGGHPRTYWPAGVASDTATGNLWSQTFLPIANNGASAWVGNVNAILYAGNPLIHGVVSYFTRDPNVPGHSILRAQPEFFRTQSVIVHTRMDSMRRRLGKEIA
jgi:hypothetical protein